MTVAIWEAVIHHHTLVAFTESLQAENDTLVQAWEDDVHRWELDPLNIPCPYDLPEVVHVTGNPWVTRPPPVPIPM